MPAFARCPLRTVTHAAVMSSMDWAELAAEEVVVPPVESDAPAHAELEHVYASAPAPVGKSPVCTVLRVCT